jgi:phosphopantothenoylcysteine decarboxylase/phosphopantothenate--cysteine ligase
MLRNKNIIIGITGGIAAYKIPLLIRLLKKEGANVKVLASEAALDFVTPLTLSVVSENPVLTSFFDDKTGAWNSHIDLGRWADIFLLAPLTANSMAKIAAGMADSLLLATLLAARCPVFFAPAMDMDMFLHPSTVQNIEKLKKLGYRYIKPVEGELASGLTGPGRMPEPEEIFKIVTGFFDAGTTFKGKKVLVSAGPTHEPIDPVRFIGNSSSGKMGVELAKAFASKGAEVNLVLGPVDIDAGFEGITVHKVTTAAQMARKCKELFKKSDIAVMAAAVADFTPAEPMTSKIKKENNPGVIKLKPTEDIIASLGKNKNENQILVGFALETDNELENAKAKLNRKNLDMIVLNSLKDKGAGFGYDTNKITVIKNNGDTVSFSLKRKKEVALDIVNEISKFLTD